MPSCEKLHRNIASRLGPANRPSPSIEGRRIAGQDCLLGPLQTLIGSVDPAALKILDRRAEYSLTESALSPFQAEPTQFLSRDWRPAAIYLLGVPEAGGVR